MNNDMNNFEIKRGDIFYINIPRDENDPHKQSGVRPCVIMSNDANNKYNSRIMYIPFTSRDKKRMPTHIPMKSTSCLQKESIALCECLDSISKRFLLERIGTVAEKDMFKIELGKDIQLSGNNKIRFLINNIKELCYV